MMTTEFITSIYEYLIQTMQKHLPAALQNAVGFVLTLGEVPRFMSWGALLGLGCPKGCRFTCLCQRCRDLPGEASRWPEYAGCCTPAFRLGWSICSSLGSGDLRGWDVQEGLACLGAVAPCAGGCLSQGLDDLHPLSSSSRSGMLRCVAEELPVPSMPPKATVPLFLAGGGRVLRTEAEGE